MSRKMLGQVEEVSLTQFGVDKVLAKVDTGAYYCRMHCDDSSMDNDGKIRFTVNGKKFVADAHGPNATVLTKGITGHEKREYAIKSFMTVRGNRYEADIILNNRENRKYKVLIGRKFLLLNDFLVDVRQGIENDIEYNGGR